jgi:hypothetical protein
MSPWGMGWLKTNPTSFLISSMYRANQFLNKVLWIGISLFHRCSVQLSLRFFMRTIGRPSSWHIYSIGNISGNNAEQGRIRVWCCSTNVAWNLVLWLLRCILIQHIIPFSTIGMKLSSITLLVTVSVIWHGFWKCFFFYIGQTLISAFFQALFCLHFRHKHPLQEVKGNPHVHVHMSSTTVWEFIFLIGLWEFRFQDNLNDQLIYMYLYFYYFWMLRYRHYVGF